MTATADNAKSNQTVLVVDDEAIVRMGAVACVTDAGYPVLEAANADAAWQILLLSDDIFALVTDIEMPGAMNGLALVRRVRALWPRMKLVVVSGRLKPSQNDLPSGARFLSKPYSPNDVLNALHA